MSRRVEKIARKALIPAIILILLSQNLYAHPLKAETPALIPMPQRIIWNHQFFKMNGNEQRIVFRLVSDLADVELNPDEAYHLEINQDSVILQATTAKGLFRGKQTLRQLTVMKNGQQYLYGCRIIDWPAFKIRGFMQDVGRNFMSLPMLKEQIDVMAAYKFNVFHFHVNDNPAWRLESKKYPQLNEAATMSRWPGKYYSQEDFLELVNYCNDRFITLIPEFDVPGHCEAFRKAFALDSMSDERVKPILLDLIDELCHLVPKDKMPYIHLGTDEVWAKHEYPADGLLEALTERVKFHRREVIVWSPGQQFNSDKSLITQLWSSNGRPIDGHRYLDSRLNYLNHLDPMAGVVQLYFDRICQASRGDSLRLGGILCCWNDNNVNEEYDILRQNPVYPGMLTYSETSWKGQTIDFGESYLAKLPEPESPLFKEFQEFENRLVRHRELYFKGKPFPYVKQTEIVWKIYGPFDHDPDPAIFFPKGRRSSGNHVKENAEKRKSTTVNGGTIHIRHFFGFPSWFSEKQGTAYAATNIWSPADQEVDCWIGFHDWSRSDGRRGGPFPQIGQWHITNPKVWVNDEAIEPPIWKNPGLAAKTEMIPFEDENYYFREPAKIKLKKGWNTVLLKVPQNGKSWKWMFTFIPVRSDGSNVSELESLIYDDEI